MVDVNVLELELLGWEMMSRQKKNNDYHFYYLVLHPLFYSGFLAWMRFPFKTWRLNVGRYKTAAVLLKCQEDQV